MKLRTAVLIGVVGLVAAITVGTVLTLSAVINSEARKDVDNQLKRNRDVFHDLIGFQQSKLKQRAEELANEPTLRAVLNTADVDFATIDDVVNQLKVKASVFIVTRANGNIRYDRANKSAKGNMLKVPLIMPALEKGQATGVWVDDKMAHLVHVVRIMFGERVVGLLALGWAFDDRLANQFQVQLGGSAGFLLRGKLIGFATDSTGCGADDCSAKADRAELSAALAGHSADATNTGTVSLFGSKQLTLIGAAKQKPKLLSFAVMRDLDEALAAGKKVTSYVFYVGGASVVVAILFAFLLSGRLSKPLDTLVVFTGDVAAGRLEKRAPVKGLSEVKTLATAMNTMVSELSTARDLAAEKERMAGELNIASRIQTSILPRTTGLPNLAVAARMVPASEVGGDYYDVHPTDDGGWIGIGDVSGHGLDAGLVMLMVQTSVSTLVQAQPNIGPEKLLRAVNTVIVDNVRNRLEGDKHMTLCMMRWHGDGRFVLAGAHMDVLVLRKDADEIEHIPTPGTWIGIIDDLGDSIVETELSLRSGDLVAVYTDGITEAMNDQGEQYDSERLAKQLIAHRTSAVADIVAATFDDVSAWQNDQEDDISLMVMRYDEAS